MTGVLKGNFNTKKKVEAKQEAAEAQTGSDKLAADFKKAALASIGGSMVYVERTQFTWDPESEEKDAEDKK